jgi:hypothetical protein
MDWVYIHIALTNINRLMLVTTNNGRTSNGPLLFFFNIYTDVERN